MVRQLTPDEPNSTIPVDFGVTTFQRFVAHKLDGNFEEQADMRMHACLQGCRRVMEHGSGTAAADELAFNLAKAAAHWRTVANDRIIGMELVAEGVTLVTLDQDQP